MGRRTVDGCVDCGLPCMGKSCPYWEVEERFCDKCGEETSQLYEYNGKELCEDCLLDAAKPAINTCEECRTPEQAELVEYEGKHICVDCLAQKLIGRKLARFTFFCEECGDWTSELYETESGQKVCKNCFLIRQGRE